MPRVVCDLCPHNCTLDKNGIGLCGNRLENLGKFSSGQLDPIEKKPLYHVNPGTKTLSLGSIGCNLKCPWCQNWSISKEFKNINSIKFKELDPTELLNLVTSENLNSLTFTYNEPTINYEYIVKAAKLLADNNIQTYIVSNGFISQKYLEPFYRNIKAVNIDLKSFNKDTYKNIIGGDLNTILNSLKYINKSNTWLEITTLLIPGLNDSEQEIRDLCNWVHIELGDYVPIHFSAYFPCYKYTNVERTPVKTILDAVKIAKDIGLKYVYSGNISDNINSNTKCPTCNTVLISRNGYKTKSFLESGCCPNPKCNRQLEGIF